MDKKNLNAVQCYIWESNSYCLASTDVTKTKIFTNWIFCVINVVSSCSDTDILDKKKDFFHVVSFLTEKNYIFAHSSFERVFFFSIDISVCVVVFEHLLLFVSEYKLIFYCCMGRRKRGGCLGPHANWFLIRGPEPLHLIQNIILSV